jgi:hypothetical protein
MVAENEEKAARRNLDRLPNDPNATADQVFKARKRVTVEHYRASQADANLTDVRNLLRSTRDADRKATTLDLIAAWAGGEKHWQGQAKTWAARSSCNHAAG